MRVLLIDYQELFRAGLRCVLQRLSGGVAELFETGDFSEGLQYAAQYPRLDLVLLDLNSHGCEWEESVKQFHQRHPHIPLIVLSGEETPPHLNRIMGYGARGLICKSSSEAEFMGALNSVLAGEVYVPPRYMKHRHNAKKYRLTQRQAEVLGCLMEGYSNKEIAAQFDVAEGTVKAHVAALYQVMKVRNRREAVLVASEYGLSDRRDAASFWVQPN